MITTRSGGLTAAQGERFWTTIEKAGLDRGVVGKYGKQTKRVLVSSLAELRDLVGPVENAMRANAAVSSGCEASENEMDRAVGYLYGNSTLSPEEISRLEQRHFPVEITVTAEEDKVIPANQTWVIARDERPQVLHFRTLTMEPGSKIEIYSTYLTLTCQRLIRES